MKKNTIILLLTLTAIFLVASSCTQDGDKYYLLNNSNSEVSSSTENMEQIFTIAGFKEKIEAKFYQTLLTSPVLDSEGNPLVADIYIPIDAATQTAIEDVPYVDFRNFYEKFCFMQRDKYYEITSSLTDSGKVRVSNPEFEDYYVEFDAENQTIFFEDYDSFMRLGYMGTILDVTDLNKKYLKKGDTNFERYGKEITLSLKKYGIPMKIIDGIVYIPFKVFSDIFSTFESPFVYKNNAFYQESAIRINSETYFEGSGTDTRSDVLKKFNYNELCLNMDFNYGLKDVHGISTFDAFFKESGLVNYFSALATPYDFTKGLDDLCLNYFADVHSVYKIPSYYTGTYTRPSDIRRNSNFRNQLELMHSYENLRESVFEAKGYTDVHSVTGVGVLDYTEVDNTAYITFDIFWDSEKDYYALTSNGTVDLEEDDIEDSFGLIIYSHQQIKKNSNIKNVVIDLSNNGGGDADCLAYISAWYLGGATINIRNSLTGAIGATSYIVDVDMDGEYGVSDTLQGLENPDGTSRKVNLYCIISPRSFSCGNALPAIFKDSGKVVLIGKKSGGGACVVYSTSSADGNIFQISSSYQVCTTKNGSFYLADEGVDVDYNISDFTNVYDRDVLTAYINALK